MQGRQAVIAREQELRLPGLLGEPERFLIRRERLGVIAMTFYGTPATGAGWIVPKKYVEKVGDDAYKKAPVGAGPYKFVSFTPGVELVMEAFDGYWRKAPSVKQITLKTVTEITTRMAMSISQPFGTWQYA